MCKNTHFVVYFSTKGGRTSPQPDYIMPIMGSMTEEQGRYAMDCAWAIVGRTRLPYAYKQDVVSMILLHIVRRWDRYDPARSSWRTWISCSARYGYQAAIRRLSRELPPTP